VDITGPGGPLSILPLGRNAMEAMHLGDQRTCGMLWRWQKRLEQRR